jgi:DNA-binding NtrC family response regulator
MGEPVAIRDDSIDDGDDLVGALQHLAELPYGEARQRLLHEFEAVYLKMLLERTHGNVARAAREAKLSRSHLNELIRRHQRGS